MLKRFYNLLNEIKLFLSSKGESSRIIDLEDREWIADLSFMIDITAHLNELNVCLQGNNRMIHQLYELIIGFEMKLNLWKNQLLSNEFDNFPTLLDLSKNGPVNTDKYGKSISILLLEFEKRFVEFKKNKNLIDLFRIPFAVEINNILENFQLEIIGLQANVHLKEIFSHVSLVDLLNVSKMQLSARAHFCSEFRPEQTVASFRKQSVSEDSIENIFFSWIYTTFLK